MRKTLIFGSLLAVFLMMMLPTVVCSRSKGSTISYNITESS